MIINPSSCKGNALEVVNGRMLVETFGLVGEHFRDVSNPHRRWTISGFFSPLPMAISGIRARVVDQHDFVSFINQRDLEVLLDIAKPGDHCAWLGEDYASPYERSWIGVCADASDLEDDLFLREAELRMMQTELTGEPLLPTGLELTRRVHIGGSLDTEELHYLSGDFDRETGMFPDLRFQTITERWVRIERRTQVWRNL